MGGVCRWPAQGSCRLFRLGIHAVGGTLTPPHLHWLTPLGSVGRVCAQSGGSSVRGGQTPSLVPRVSWHGDRRLEGAAAVFAAWGCRAHGRGQHSEGGLISETLQQGRDDVTGVCVTRQPRGSRPGLLGPRMTLVGAVGVSVTRGQLRREQNCHQCSLPHDASSEWAHAGGLVLWYATTNTPKRTFLNKPPFCSRPGESGVLEGRDRVSCL